MSIYGDAKLLFDPQVGHGDLSIADRDLERDDGLETAVLISLFTDARAGDDDILPDSGSARRGWWADSVGSSSVAKGSKLWLLSRAKPIANEVCPRAEQYCKDALQWMIDDGVADSVSTACSIVDKSYMQISILIKRPSIAAVSYRYFYNWQAQALRGL